MTGPRQSGKTTLARAAFPGKPSVSLEDPDTRRFAIDDPRAFLSGLRGGAVLDEIQRAPELTSYLQGTVDEDPRPGRFVMTGSQQSELMRGVSQSLAGRTAILRMLPFTAAEVLRVHRRRAEASPPMVSAALPWGNVLRFTNSVTSRPRAAKSR